MSSLSGSLVTEKDRSETIAQIRTPTDSLTSPSTSNPSIIITEKNKSSTHRKYLPIQNSSSKKTFTLNRENDFLDPREILLFEQIDQRNKPYHHFN